MRAMSRMSSAVRIEPVGLCGELMTISRVRGVTNDSTSTTSMRKSFSSRRVPRPRCRPRIGPWTRRSGSRVGVDDLVALVDQGEHRVEHDRLGARRDDHLLRRRVDPLPALHVGGDRLAQGGDAGGGRVVGQPLIQHASGRRLADVAGRVEVRLADLQVDDVAPVASRARARAAASKAVSVPIRSMRLASFTRVQGLQRRVGSAQSVPIQPCHRRIGIPAIGPLPCVACALLYFPKRPLYGEPRPR